MLRRRGHVALSALHSPSRFDHGDIHAPSGQLYVAHLDGNSVEVIDGPGLKHVASIRICREASGVRTCPEDNLVVAAGRADGVLLVIEPDTHEVRFTIEVGGRPNGLAWDPTRRYVFVADSDGTSSAIVEPSSGSIVAVVSLNSGTAWAAYDRVADRYLINIRSASGVVVINPITARVEATWPIRAAGPHGLDLDPNGRYVFVASDDASFTCLDADDGRELWSLRLAGQPDAIWFNAITDQVYVAISNPGLVEVVDANSARIVERLETALGVHTLALDSDRQELYVFNPDPCSIVAYRVEP